MKVVAVTKNSSQAKNLVPLHSSVSMEILLSSTKPLCPAISYRGRANDAKRCSLKFDFVRKALLNCGVDVIVDQVEYLVLNADCLFMSIHIMAFLRNKSNT